MCECVFARGNGGQVAHIDNGYPTFDRRLSFSQIAPPLGDCSLRRFGGSLADCGHCMRSVPMENLL
jgi:hypothetical protein